MGNDIGKIIVQNAMIKVHMNVVRTYTNVAKSGIEKYISLRK